MDGCQKLESKVEGGKVFVRISPDGEWQEVVEGQPSERPPNWSTTLQTGPTTIGVFPRDTKGGALMEDAIERPRTVEEMAALPEFNFGLEEHVLTAADKERGYIVVRGRQINCIVPASKIVIPVEPATIASYAGPDDPLGYTDEEGVIWSIGRYADGSWFRRRR